MCALSSAKTNIPESPAQLRKNLLSQTIRLIAAQGGYCLLALSIILKGKPLPWEAHPGAGAIVLTGVVIAAVFPVLSAGYVTSFAKLPKTNAWDLVAPLLLRRFFAGYAISQIAALMGLFFFFVYGRVWAVTITAIFTTIGIIWHYLDVRRKTHEFEQQKSPAEQATSSPPAPR
jgi:hypothetical protein